MAKQNTVTIYKVFIASPGDTQAERTIVRELCETINREGLARSKKVQLQPFGWEEAMPQAGDPQEIINRLAEDCDLLVCIFHRRFGSPTAHQASGTLEEFLNAYESWKACQKPQIFLFFKQVAITSEADLEDAQLRKVMKFKTQIKDNHLLLYKEIIAESQFRTMLKKHLEDWLIDNKTNPKPVKSKRKPRGKNPPDASSHSASPLPEPVLAKYRKHALQKHAHLPIQGFETSFRHPVLIERVYVKMRAHLQVNDCARTLQEREEEQAALREQQIGIVDLKGALAAARRHQIKDLVILGDPGAGKTTLLKYITVMLLQGKGEEKLGITEKLIPFLAPLRELRKPGAESFCSFLARVCKFGEWGIGEEAFRALLDSRQGLILLDGLDEVANKAQRLAVIRWIDRAREECVYTTFIVTSRFAGYFGEYQLGGNILPLSIQAFTEEEIAEFLGNWFTAVEECLHPGVAGAGSQGAEKAAALAEIIRGNENLRSFVTNPLLLQITALVYRDRGSLPERRIDLYRECTKILLGNWDRAKGLEVSLRPEAAQQLLQPVALWLHRENDRRYAPLTEVLQVLKKPLQQLGKGNLDARQLLENIRDRSGVFVGYTEKDYGFIHLTFQEYLAAEEIHSHRLIDLLVANYNNKWWREVILLTMALDNPSLIEPFLEQVVRQPVFLEDITLVQDAIRDSQVKPLDVLLKALEERKVKSGARQRIINLLQEWEDERITAALRKLAQGKDRAVVETAYAVLEKRGQAAGLQPGREEAGERERVWAKDQAEMVLIPAGVFLYGSREDDKEAQQDEKPQRSIELPAFWMDRYPVTNRQYCLFLNEVQPGAKELEKWIYLAGKSEKEKCRIEKKGREYLVESGYRKYPVIYVTWNGASTYAKWAGKELPTEQQWEKAARGMDGRKYPWGNEWKKGMCNSAESGIRMTTPVEKYPEGKSVYGCYDMAGNVWEWTDSKYSKTSSSYVVRGGACYFTHDNCRCAYRFSSNPDYRYYHIGFRCART